MRLASSPMFPPRQSGARRGSILLLVLVVLAVLTLLATTLFYVSKLELLAADNAARTVQNRMGAATGIPVAISLLSEQWGAPVALNQSWARTPRAPGAQSGALQADSKDTTETVSFPPWPGWLDIQDASALLNINAVLPYPRPGDSAAPVIPGAMPARVLESLIAQRLFAENFDPAAAPAITRLILGARWGRDGRPGSAAPDPDDGIGLQAAHSNAATRAPDALPHAPARPALPKPGAPHNLSRSPGPAKEDPNDMADSRAFTADMRQKPIGNDRFFKTLDDLRNLPKMPAEAFDAIAPFLTVFSSALEIWRDSDGQTWLPVSVNTATPQQILETLQRLYPHADENVLKQFALNIVDRRDPDSVPSSFPDSGPYPILGYERTPYISEVCPDVITFTEDGDNGEYIEIHNPLSVPVNLRGWRIDWGAGSHVLDVILQPGACLVLTDDIDNKNDPNPEDRSPGMGSFVAIFGMPLLGKNVLIENPAMDLPDDSGVVRLLDDRGNLIDYLVYRSGTFTGVHVGHHRRAIHSRLGEPGPASPFRAELPREIADPYAKACAQIFENKMNALFQNTAELLAVPCPDPAFKAGIGPVSPPFPLLAVSGGQEPDLQLLDAFTVSATREKAGGPRRWEARPDLARDTAAPEDPVSFGKINLNTAPREVLLSLPGLDHDLVELILRYRSTLEASAPAFSRKTAGKRREETAPFRSLSDFAANLNVWGGRDPARRLEALFALSPLATFNSTAFLARTDHPSDPAEAGESPVSGLGCRSLIHLTGSGAQTLDWRFWFPETQSRGFQAEMKTGAARNSFDKTTPKN